MSTEKPPSSAAGLGGIAKSVSVGLREMGAVRMLRGWSAINQRGGFDCPSCAWADPDGPRHTAEFCENGAKALADDATTKKIGREFFAKYSVEELRQQSEFWLNAQGRIAEPMVWRDGDSHYRPIEWAEAFGLVARSLNALDSPDRAAFYTSGKASNEAAFLFQLFARAFGTNNLPDCSNMCHESSGTGLKETIGIGKSTVTLDDLERAKCIIVIGQNPGTNHPRMLTSLAKAKRGGASIIAINPLKEVGLLRFTNPQQPLGWLGDGESLTDLYLQVKINGDVAALKGIAKAILEIGAADREFIDRHTDGFDRFAADATSATWETISSASGLTRESIEAAARLIAASPGVVICWAMGLTQHKNAVDNVRGLVNLALVTGSIGKPGAGLMCVRGHSNVQGDRTMGIGHHMDDRFHDALDREFGFRSPRSVGLDTVQAIHAMRDGNVRVFVSLGGNFLSATPDTEVVTSALAQCELNASIVTKLNRSHLVGMTRLLLPCLGRSERDVQESGPQFTTMENTVSVVSTSEGIFEPASPALKSEVAIIAGLAKATLGGRSTARIDWDALTANYDRIRDHIERVVPGFEKFNERVRQPGGFYLPIPPKDRVFNTPTGRAQFSITPIQAWHLKAGEFLLMTVRTHDQFNTVVYGMDDRYRGVKNDRRVVFINRDDMRDAGFTEGQKVNLTSHFDGRERQVRDFSLVGYDIPRGCLAAYFPETNPLVALESVADGSNTPASKSVVVTLQVSG
ncbi:MAG: FdhF/YdeP family oxidoreductase [Acidobacteria bacterium]|nr:MAG: FdhF/YdeP family oxidoreductase [Acidobacteriota bacterium]